MAELDYAHHATARHNDDEWPSKRFFVIALVLAITPQTGGVGLVFATLLTRNRDFALYGLYWLAIGGAITVIAIAFSMVFGASISVERPNIKRQRFRATLLFTLAMSNIPIAAGCVVVGIAVIR